MSAANPSPQSATALAPFYRRYELPWSPSEEMERRYWVILRNLAIVFVIFAVLLPFLPRHEQVVNTDSLPERVVQLVMEPPPPPPPPPPPKPEKPLEKAPVSAKPTPATPVDPRVKASKSGLLANLDDLAALRDVNLDKLSKDQPATTDPGDVSAVTRSVITSKVGGTSGGISAPSSSGLAAGSGSLNGIRTAQVKDPALAGNGHGATRAGGSGKASRGADEIALVFTRNKGAIDAMYARALRDNPSLQGKVVIEITISPAGDITAARIVSSDLNAPEFEAKLLARVRLFKFEARDVAALTATKPIDFFPRRMNIQSEIDFFSDLALVDKARFVNRLVSEVCEEAKLGASESSEASCLKFAIEISQRLARFSYQLLSEDVARPADDVVIRMLLGARADKNAERIVQNAYRRVLTSFESFDTTVLLNPH